MLQFRQATVHLVYFFNVLLLFLLVFEEYVQLPAFLQVAGRMHPLLLHFPIALLFLGLFIEWFIGRRQPDNGALREVTAAVFSLLALSAALTALFGFFLYQEGSYAGDEIQRHKWAGTLVSLLAGLLLWLKEKSSAAYFPALVLSAAAITFTGHSGAEITHGEGFLTEPIRRQQSAKTLSIDNPDSAIVFRDVIQPIFNEKCASCHNLNKAKGELILTDYASVVKGGESRNVLVPGNAAESLLYKYALLPMEDSLHMPPKGKQQLDKAEIDLIGWWINSGARPDEQYVDLPRADSIHPIMLSLFQPKTGLDRRNIAFADPKKVKSLNTPYRTVQQLSATRPYIAVFTGSRTNFSVRDLSELKDIREQVVSLDLGNSNVTDQDLKAVAQFPHLQKVHLQNSPVSDEGIRQLANLPFLETINLSGTRISPEALDELSRWQGLKKVFLYNTPISEEHIARIRENTPSLELYNTQLDLSDSLYNARLSRPECKIDSVLFRRRAMVDVKLSRGKVNYYYTLDGSEPTPASTRYTGPFPVEKSAQLKVMATMAGWQDSPVSTHSLLKLGAKPEKIFLENKPDTKQKGSLDSMLVDGKSGSLYRYDPEYLGYLGQDMQATFTFDQARSLSRFTISYLEDMENGVTPPVEMEVWGGTSKTSLKKLGTATHPIPPENRTAARYLMTVQFERQPLTHIRLRVKNPGNLPGWHYLQKETKAWILIDEISLE